MSVFFDLKVCTTTTNASTVGNENVLLGFLGKGKKGGKNSDKKVCK
jgi:hypothetical protein